MAARITIPVADLLRTQISSELTAHSNYMAISIYFRRSSLDKWGELFHHQALEEAQHAGKIIAFLLDTEEDFDLPTIPGASTKFASPLDAIKAAAYSEAKVTGEFNRLATVARENNDHVAGQFLQWFIEEQVEEESKMAKLIDLVESGVNLFQAQSLLADFE